MTAPAHPCAHGIPYFLYICDRNPVVRLMAPTVGAAKRNQLFMVADTALYAQKPMRQSATFEVLIEFLLYVV
jgi:hypothetical protein